MRHLSGLFKRVSLRRTAAAALCCSMLLVITATARAQSGRRMQKRSPSSAAPVQGAKPTETPAVIARAERPQLSLYVCTSQYDLSSNINKSLSEAIRNVFVQRLGEASSINVVTGGEVLRGDAIKRAKNEESTYVVLLSLDTDIFDPQDNNRIRLGDYSRVFIRYTVFAPATGKVRLEGRSFQEQYRIGRGGVGLPSPGRTNSRYSDYLLKEAARQAADRVLESFRASQPRDPALKTKR